MDYTFEESVLKDLKKIRKSDLSLYEKILNKIEIFKNNEKHQSLRVHKLHGEFDGYWSLSVNRSIRLIYRVKDNEICFIGVGTHDEMYRMN